MVLEAAIINPMFSASTFVLPLYFGCLRTFYECFCFASQFSKLKADWLFDKIPAMFLTQSYT